MSRLEKLRTIQINSQSDYSYKGNMSFFIDHANITCEDKENANEIMSQKNMILDYSDLPEQIACLKKGEGSKPIAYIVVGNIGSGKSSFIHAMCCSKLLSDEVILIMEDVYKKIFFNSEYDLKKAYSYAKFFVSKKIIDIIRQGRDFLLEMVPSSLEKIKLIEAIRKAGYEISIFYIDTESVDVNIERNNKRQKDGADYVSEGKVYSRDIITQKNFTKLLNVSDSLYYYLSDTEVFELCYIWLGGECAILKNSYRLEKIIKGGE